MGHKVAVIGAGPSGLTTVKELLAEGHEPICFERASGLGGVYRFDESDGAVWESARLTSSGLMIAFSDFPVPDHRAGHMTITEYLEYLCAYGERFGALSHVQLGTTVQSVTPVDGGRWRVTVSDRRGRVQVGEYDAVAVCSGLPHTPNRPPFQGEATFTGTILHSSQYRRQGQVEGKRILVVGGGESGADIAAEASACAADTVLSLRRGVAAIPRTRNGMPSDYLTSRLTNSAAHWVFQTRNPKDDGKRLVYYVAFFPLALLDKIVRLVKAPLAWLAPLEFLRPGRGGVAAARLASRTKHLSKQLLAGSGGVLTEQFATKSDEFVKAMAQGRCRLAPGLDRFDGDIVRFTDGSTFAPDVVILCTGFNGNAPFLSDDLATAPRYLHTFLPAIGQGLAFIGHVRPAMGAIPPLAELQARWFGRLLSGQATLPSRAAMEAAIDRQKRRRRHVFRAVRDRLEYLVDYTSTCDELAAMIGCKPTRAALRRERARFRLRFYAAPFVAAQYRLVGPHARPDIARGVIERLPIACRPESIAAYFMRWQLTRCLARLLGPDFSPNLDLD